MSKRKQVLAHLKRGPITQKQAIRLFNCYRLAPRIGELRESGHIIHTERVHRGGKTFARYSLATK